MSTLTIWAIIILTMHADGTAPTATRWETSEHVTTQTECREIESMVNQRDSVHTMALCVPRTFKVQL